MAKFTPATALAIVGVAAVLALVMYGSSGWQPPARPAPRLGGRAGPTTSREDLARTIESMEARLRARGTDREAALLLAEASMRQARVTGDGALNRRAAEVMARVVRDEPADYETRRMLATVYAAEHRFRDAIREASWCREREPADPWNYGVIGDSHLELGDYDEAFAAFQAMVDLRPTSDAYARMSYAFELRGMLDEAIEAMKVAADGANPRDPEAIAWYNAHLADLYLDVGRLPEARMAYAWAERAFPGHPLVRAGIARLKEAEGDLAGAMAMYREEVPRTAAPDVAAALGDLYRRTGNVAEAERMYVLAEERWSAGGPAERDHLARFLADRDRRVAEAVRLAESSGGADIVAQDALAWACFKAGRLADADRAATRALRTGTRNLEILYHAAAIRRALGDDRGAHALLDRAPRATHRYPRASAAAEWLRAQLETAEAAASGHR